MEEHKINVSTGETPEHQPQHQLHQAVHGEACGSRAIGSRGSGESGTSWTGFQKLLAAAAFFQIVLLLYMIGGISDLSISGGSAVTGAAVKVAAPAPSLPSPSAAAVIDMEALADDDPVLGDADAPVTIIEFSDYECPFCARFYSQTLGQIDDEYIQTGKVKLIYRDFPLSFHPQAEPAAIAANCAGKQRKYFEFHDKIFDNGGASGKSATDYKQWAQEIGLDVAEWEQCLSDPTQRQEIQKDIADGAAAGIQGTPGFIINGNLVSGAQPFSVFQQVIEAELN